MFAKLKQKIAEEESSAETARPRPSSPSVRRQKINGFSENKWEKRRLSNASSLYGSKESITSSNSTYSSGFNVSRRNSFRTGAATPADSSSRSVRNQNLWISRFSHYFLMPQWLVLSLSFIQCVVLRNFYNGPYFCVIILWDLNVLALQMHSVW